MFMASAWFCCPLWVWVEHLAVSYSRYLSLCFSGLHSKLPSSHLQDMLQAVGTVPVQKGLIMVIRDIPETGRTSWSGEQWTPKEQTAGPTSQHIYHGCTCMSMCVLGTKVLCSSLVSQWNPFYWEVHFLLAWMLFWVRVFTSASPTSRLLYCV